VECDFADGAVRIRQMSAAGVIHERKNLRQQQASCKAKVFRPQDTKLFWARRCVKLSFVKV
jgi:hypothetical protein